MSFRDKQSRNLCYASRDRYWECLDAVPIAAEDASANGTISSDVTSDVGDDGQSSAARREARTSRLPATHQPKYGARLQANAEQTGGHKPCMELRRLCQASCPEHWMKHFDRKRQYMLFRQKVAAVGRMDTTSDPAKSQNSIQDQKYHSDNSMENPPQTFLDSGDSNNEMAGASPHSASQNGSTVMLRNKGKCTNGLSNNRYSVGSCLPDINITPAIPERRSSKDSGNLSSNFRLSLNIEDSDSRLHVPSSASCSLLSISSESLSPGCALSRTASDSYLRNVLGHPSLKESSSAERISRSSNELEMGSSALGERSLTERMMFAFQFPFCSSRSPSPNVSPYSSLAPSPSSPDLTSIAPARKRRVYSQAVFRQRLVPTN